MEYIAAALTDKGNTRKTNQDSICIKIANRENGSQVVLAIICDGMGGFSKGELASATVIRRFAKWYENELPLLIQDYDLCAIGKEWKRIIENQNSVLMKYGQSSNIKLGTTISALLIIDDEYLIFHIGDSRVYKVCDDIEQMTSDHTLVAKEVAEGKISQSEAKSDRRRHVLLQCVGASKKIDAEIKYGSIRKNTLFILCSDGLYNTIGEPELLYIADTKKLNSIGKLRKACSKLIEKAKNNGERDNVSIAMIRSLNKKEI